MAGFRVRPEVGFKVKGAELGGWNGREKGWGLRAELELGQDEPWGRP